MYKNIPMTVHVLRYFFCGTATWSSRHSFKQYIHIICISIRTIISNLLKFISRISVSYRPSHLHQVSNVPEDVTWMLHLYIIHYIHTFKYLVDTMPTFQSTCKKLCLEINYSILYKSLHGRMI